MTIACQIVDILATGSLNITSIPNNARIWLALTGQTLVDQGINTNSILTAVVGTYDIKLVLAGYQDWTGTATVLDGQTTTVSAILSLTCPVSPKYSGNNIILQATPKDGIGPYYVEFFKDGFSINSSRLGGLDNPITGALENIDITRIYTLDDIDVALSDGTIDFSVYISDSCPTGIKTCTETCTINIGCLAPVCNFTVT